MFFALRSNEEKVVPRLAAENPTTVAASTNSSVVKSSTTTLPQRNWETTARSVVLIEASGEDCEWSGSGSIVLDGSYILTNQHVSGDGECDLNVWFTDSTTTQPRRFIRAELIVADAESDLAVLRMFDENGPFIDPTRLPLEFSRVSPRLGDKIYTLGYPALGGSTITLTSGDVSGTEISENYRYLKTTANMNPGLSGGAAVDAMGKLIGVPTAGIGADVECENQGECVAVGSTIGLLRPIAYALELIESAGLLN